MSLLSAIGSKKLTHSISFNIDLQFKIANKSQSLIHITAFILWLPFKWLI